MLATGFFEWISGVEPIKVGVFFVVPIAASIVGVAWAIANAWKGVRRSEHQTRLTALMLERGLKSEEIERLLKAGTVFVNSDPICTRPGESDPEVRVVNALSAQSYDGDDIEKVLGAARLNGEIDESAVAIVKTLAENWADADDIVKVLRNRSVRPPILQGSTDSPTRPATA